jgi:hypothetical protein
MSESPDENGPTHEVSDDQLPEDLQPTEENPLARHPDQTGDSDDEIGADTESEPQTAPMDQDEAEYGGAGRGSDD